MIRSTTTIRTTSRLAALACALLLALDAAAARGGAGDPKAVVRDTTDRVIAVLARTELSVDEKRREIEAIVYEQVDFDTVARLVLARNWRRFSEQQRAQFIAEFKRHLSETYGRNVDGYRNERVQILSARDEARGDVTVNTKVAPDSAGGEEVLVNYRLRQRDGRWRIIDIVIEGVSLVSNFRSQFQDIMARGGPEHVLDVLRRKNAEGAAS